MLHIHFGVFHAAQSGNGAEQCPPREVLVLHEKEEKEVRDTRVRTRTKKKPNTKKKKNPIEEERRISIGTECKREHIIL